MRQYSAISLFAQTLRGARRVEWFLVLWLAVEGAGYFVLSPFPAARRVLGLIVVAAGQLRLGTSARVSFRRVDSLALS